MTFDEALDHIVSLAIAICVAPTPTRANYVEHSTSSVRRAPE